MDENDAGTVAWIEKTDLCQWRGLLFAEMRIKRRATLRNMIQKTYFKTKEYCKVKFSLTPDNADTVEVLGLNNDWESGVVLKRKKDGSFSGDVSLPKPSQHEFRYRVNATDWVNDPEADNEVPNAFGSSNSLLVL